MYLGWIEVANKKDRKTPGWLKHPTRINSTILISYLELSEQYENITERMIRNKCSTINDFKGNFNQMKNFSEKDHGKVFEENFGIISLWKPVEKFIIEQYSRFKN